jgi:hypothetical protein
MAIAFRNESHVTGTGNGATPSEPASAALNDVFAALAFCDTASSSLGIPSGWISKFSGVSSNSLFRYDLAWVRRGSSAPSLSWTMSGSAYREVFIVAYSGCVTSGDPFEAATDGGNVANGSNPDCPSVTTINANAMALAAAINWSGSGGGGWTAPSGYTLRTNNAAGNDGMISEKLVVSAGAENPGVYSGAGGTNNVWTATLALKADTGGAATSLVFQNQPFQHLIVR